MSRLVGEEDDLDRNRYTDGVEIQHESGPVAPDTSRKDYGSVFTQRPVGQSGTTYGLLTGAALQAPYNTVAGWSAITTAQFNITINSIKNNVVANLTNAISMNEIAERIQAGLRDYWTEATCEFVTDHFVITMPPEGSTIGYVEAGDGTTDIGTAIMRCESGTGTASNENYTEPSTIGYLDVPIDPVTGLYDSHWTNYSLYCTMAIGGENPVTRDINNEELYILNVDIPVAKAFKCTTSGYNFTMLEGEVCQGDKGSVVQFVDGSYNTIVTVTSSTTGTFVSSTTLTNASCALGGIPYNGKGMRVMTASLAGTTVTRTEGDTFLSTDVGRPLFFPDGTIKWIKSYTDANNVEVTVAGTISSTACGLDPKERKWNDTVRDEPYGNEECLRARVRKYTCQNRFFVPIPNCDMGEVTASMIWGAIKGEYIVHYSASDTNYRHQAGYYYESEQRMIFKEKITEISEVKGVLTIKFNNSTRYIPINAFNSIDITDAGTAIIKATGNEVVSEYIGCLHQGGVCYLPDGTQIVITSEPMIRRFYGDSYGPNLAAKRIQEYLELLVPEYSTWYDPINGWTMNAKIKVDA
jgi:hypothetical protein